MKKLLMAFAEIRKIVGYKLCKIITNELIIRDKGLIKGLVKLLKHLFKNLLAISRSGSNHNGHRKSLTSLEKYMFNTAVNKDIYEIITTLSDNLQTNIFLYNFTITCFYQFMMKSSCSGYTFEH